MRLILQRVRQAGVIVAGEEVARIGPGLMILAGFGKEDDPSLRQTAFWTKMIGKVMGLRIFPDAGGKLNLSVGDIGGEVLLVSQFTLYADCRKGRRPSFTDAAPPEAARILFDALSEDFDAALPGKVQTGRFGEDMDVWLTNWGPVTITLSPETMGG